MAELGHGAKVGDKRGDGSLDVKRPAVSVGASGRARDSDELVLENLITQRILSVVELMSRSAADG